jgi:DNA-binding MarR family transcriptional regulator
MDKVAVSRAVSSLMRSRRVVRARANSDRRRSELKLSRQGESVYWRVVPFARAYEQQLLADLSASERASLDQLLNRLHERARVLGPVRVE